MKKTLLLCSCLFLAGCNAELNTQFLRQAISPPEQWQEETRVDPVQDNWLASFQREDLIDLVDTAMQSNLEIQQTALNVAIKEQNVTSARSSLFPTLDFSFSQKRATSTTDVNPTNTTTLGLNMGYELDVWGKLSDNERAAARDLIYARATYEQARQDLAADIANAWLNVIKAQELLSLYEKRTDTARSTLTIIEGGYERGLNEALDVYLGRNQVDSELSRTASQEANLQEAVRKLERYLGQYPGAALRVSGPVPVLDAPVNLGLPADLILRKESLAASWNSLLAQDARLAYAHKERLPKLSFTNSLSDTKNLPANLFNGAALAWSLLGNISAPLFDAGNLKAKEEIERLELQQAEYQYLSDIYDAYQDVENAITQESSLKRQLRATQMAEENAKTALDLSFEQYQRGLVTYTTVLEALSRHHDAQDTLIQIKTELISNRIALHVALGGDFEAKDEKGETTR